MINAELAREGARTGALLAASKADREIESWSEAASQLFVMYANMHPEGFMTEDVREWADKLGFEAPPDKRAWGYVARAAARDGIVKSVGFGQQRSANCHGSPKTIWRKRK